MSICLYTDQMGQELFSESKVFYAESCILDAVDTNVYEVEVEESVNLQIKHEKDGIKVYGVYPRQVLSITMLSEGNV